MDSNRISLRPKASASYLGVSIATFWRYAKSDPTFPELIKLSPGVTVIDRDELTAWRDAHRGAKWAA